MGWSSIAETILAVGWRSSSHACLSSSGIDSTLGAEQRHGDPVGLGERRVDEAMVARVRRIELPDDQAVGHAITAPARRQSRRPTTHIARKTT
jgi:hypothetical protein